MAETPWAVSARCVESAPRAVEVYRRVRGLSLREAAAEIGVSFTVLYRFEQGEAVLSRQLPIILRWLDQNWEQVANEVRLSSPPS